MGGRGSLQAETRKPQVPGSFDVPFATSLLAVVLAYAWTQRNEGHLTAETGTGYWLGIVGSIMMLLLLLYPLRKRIRAMNWMGAVPGWFRIHMVLGILGPGLVVLHSNFTLGSLNSRVALLCMLTVAGSGYIGRFLYHRVYRGMSGRKMAANELRQAASDQWPALLRYSNDGMDIEESLAKFEQRFLMDDQGIATSILRWMAAGPARRVLHHKIMQATRLADAGEQRKLGLAVDAYMKAARETQNFILFERLFSLWHLLHLPLFLVLAAAAVLHIVAVHLF